MTPIVFAGPSLHGLRLPPDPGFKLAPPAGCGDVLRAVEQGRKVIALIDGTFAGAGAFAIVGGLDTLAGADAALAEPGAFSLCDSGSKNTNASTASTPSTSKLARTSDAVDGDFLASPVYPPNR